MTGGLMRRRRGTPLERSRDSGAVTILFAVGITAIIMIITVSVDVSGSLRASLRARALAEQAARAGADQINIGTALAGNGTPIDNTNNNLAVQTAACGPGALPADAQCVGAVKVGPNTVTVTVTLTYHSLLHTMFGFTDQAQTARATALLINSAPPSP